MVDKNSPIFIACRPTGIIAILLAFFIAILLSNNASAVDFSNNGFETGDFTNWSNSGASVLSSIVYEGSYSANIHESGYDTDNAYFSQTVDLTDMDRLTFWYYIDTNSGTWVFKYFFNDHTSGNLVPIVSGTAPGTTGSWVQYEVNTTSKSGNNVFGVYASAGVPYPPAPAPPGYFGEISVFVDNFMIASGAAPEFDDVSWDQDPYYTGETANITTNILNFDDGTYSYYLDLYNTNDYLTTFELTSETESNYYTFPLGWTDTSLLAKLVRVTDPYATNEVQLAYDISHFETLDWDTTVSFNKSSYNPSEALKVTWSGAANGSDVWLRAGDDGEVIESDVAYSGSFTFNVPANTTETYYIVDVATGGYSQAQASCEISSVPDFFFNYSVDVDQDEYYHGDWVTVTYSTDSPAVIKVFDDTNADIWHYLDVPAAVINETWIYYIGDTDPFGSYSVLFGNDDFLVSDYYSVVSSTSFVQVVPESMYMYETMKIWYVTNGSSTLSIKDSSDSILFQQTVNSSSLESISYIPTVSDILTITLSDVPADATDSIIVYWAADPDDVPDDDDVIDDDVIEDVLDDDETMTEYFDDKFREFAPTAWGIFLLSIILWLMAILTSFGGSSKRR